MTRHGSIIGISEENLPEYRRLHSAVWPAVLAKIHACQIRNYSIFLRRMPDGKHYLFSYFEYVGADLETDMASMAADATTQEWWKLCKPLQRPLEDRAAGEWWAGAEEVFHAD